MCLLSSVHCTLHAPHLYPHHTHTHAEVWTQSSDFLWSNSLHSLTLQHPAQSLPPTSVFNQLVPFISGSLEKKGSRIERVPSIEFELKPEFTCRPTTTLTCFQAMIQSLWKTSRMYPWSQDTFSTACLGSAGREGTKMKMVDISDTRSHFKIRNVPFTGHGVKAARCKAEKEMCVLLKILFNWEKF